MQYTLEQILQAVGAYTEQDTTLPTGSDLTARVNYVNRSINEWANAYPWDDLRYISNPTLTTNSQVTIDLPITLESLLAPLTEYRDSTTYTYPLINPAERFTKQSSDYYSYMVGDSARGRKLIVNPGLASGASVYIDYLSAPSSLATLADIAQCPNPEYVVQRTIAYVLESRGDPRFPQVKADADRVLAGMIEDQNAPSPAEINQISSQFERTGFTIGED